MWLLVMLGVAFWKISIDVAAVANLCAVLLAVWLLSSRSRADRVSGGIMLILQCVTAIIFCWHYLPKGK